MKANTVTYIRIYQSPIVIRYLKEEIQVIILRLSQINKVTLEAKIKNHHNRQQKNITYN